MKKTEWNNYWDKKINEHFKVKPAERINLREFVVQVFNEKYGIKTELANLGGDNLIKRDNLNTFLKMIADGTPFDLSDSWLLDPKTKEPRYDFSSEEAKKITIDRNGKNTKQSLKMIDDYKKEKVEWNDIKSKLQFDTDLYNEEDQAYILNLRALGKTDVFGGKGASDPDGAQWEELFIYVINGKKESDKTATVDKFMNPFVSQAETIISYLKKKGTPIPRGAEGTGKTPGDISPEWQEGWDIVNKIAKGATRTAKTDVMVKKGDYRISFKKAGGSQLMSGGQGETMATFYGVSRKLIKPEKMQEWLGETQDLIVNTMDSVSLPQGKTTKDLQRQVKDKVSKGQALDPTETAIKFMEEGQDKLESVTKNMFEKEIPDDIAKNVKGITNSKSFKYHFVHEAMTGEIKFADGPATANYVFVFEPSRGTGELKKIDKAEVESVASKTSYNFSFKSSGAGKISWSAIKLIYQDKKKSAKKQIGAEIEENLTLQEVFSTLFAEQCDMIRETFANSQNGKLLKEDIRRSLDRTLLTESTKKEIVENLFGKVWDKVKTGAIALKDWAAKAFSVLKKVAIETAMTVVNAIKEVATKGFNKFMEFIGIQLDPAVDPMPQQPDVGAILLGS